MKHGVLINTLGALALGVFCFCACSNPSTPDAFPQDRNVTAMDLPEIDSNIVDSILAGTYPDSLSGWELHWSQPISTAGAVALYVLGDSLGEATKSKLANGAGDFDFGSAGLAPPLARLQVTDSSWRIPARILRGRGRALPTDTIFWFSVWIRYADGAVGPPVRVRFTLGDEYPPEIPDIDTVVGQTTFRMEFDRPRDMKSRFDFEYQGKVSAIRAIWWRGSSPRDSSVVVENGTVVRHPDTLYVNRDSLRDTTIHRLRLQLTGLAYDSPYMIILQCFDDTGNVSTLGPFPVNTRDSRVPSPASGGSVRIETKNRVQILWSPATDSFANDRYLPATAPNFRIRTYRILLASPSTSRWRAVDSIDLYSEDTANFQAGATWPARSALSRFSWDGARWHWIWPNLPPGDSFRVAILVRDRSGNPSDDTLFAGGTTTAITGITCPPGLGVVPIPGNDTIQNYCIERFEHARGGSIDHNVTWLEAGKACQDAGGELCSEWQWQRACETAPDTNRIFPFGALETGSDQGLDTLAWLEAACGLGGGSSDSAVANDSARRDPRCVSGWGVRDLPGQFAEWTRDVWRSRFDSVKASQRDPWSGAYLDTSDYTRKNDLGVLRGGSWLDVTDRTVRLNLARCRGRTYPATSAKDTLPGGKIIPEPDPSGRARSWGYRCCFKPL